MTVTATVVLAVDDGPLGGPVPFGTSFVDSLVGRLHAEYGADRHEIRRLAMEVLGTFATARVQAFIPILVEKRLRETYRALRDRGGTARSIGERDVRLDPLVAIPGEPGRAPGAGGGQGAPRVPPPLPGQGPRGGTNASRMTKGTATSAREPRVHHRRACIDSTAHLPGAILGARGSWPSRCAGSSPSLNYRAGTSVSADAGPAIVWERPVPTGACR